MEVILLEKVENVGALGDKVKVKAGFGRNYLIPKGKAAPATADNIKAFEARRAELERVAAERLGAAEQRRGMLEGIVVTIPARIGGEGKLFGSIGTGDIAEAVTKAGVPVSKAEVRLPQGPFRVAGEYMVDLHLHTDINASVKINIVAEE